MKVTRCDSLGRENTAGLQWLKEQVIAAVDEMKADPRMANILSLHGALNTLENTAGLEKTTLVELFGLTKNVRKGD